MVFFASLVLMGVFGTLLQAQWMVLLLVLHCISVRFDGTFGIMLQAQSEGIC